MVRRLVCLLGLLAGILAAADAHKAVFDCSSGDFDYVRSRIFLMEKTVAMLKERKEPYDFVLTVHSGCTPIVAKLPDMMVPDEEVPIVYAMHAGLKRLHEQGVRLLACEIAMGAHGLNKSDLLPFVGTTSNSIIDLIDLQNQGYGAVNFSR